MERRTLQQTRATPSTTERGDNFVEHTVEVQDQKLRIRVQHVGDYVYAFSTFSASEEPAWATSFGTGLGD